MHFPQVWGSELSIKLHRLSSPAPKYSLQVGTSSTYLQEVFLWLCLMLLDGVDNVKRVTHRTAGQEQER